MYIKQLSFKTHNSESVYKSKTVVVSFILIKSDVHEITNLLMKKIKRLTSSIIAATIERRVMGSTVWR